MARSTKRGGKKNRKVVFRKNRLKNKWKNEKKKRGIRVQNNLIQQAWDKSASNKKNMHRMGLAFDVNDRLSGMANEKASNNEDNQTSKFIETFEEELKKRCAMERDSKNYFRRTSGQIRRAIQAFKKMPMQYNAYLLLKNAARVLQTSKWADCLLKSHSNILTRKNAVNTKTMNARLCLHHKEDLHSNLTELSVFLHCCYLLE
ncbi:Nucleolar protein 16, partial [Trichinella pseudospiralis]